jgi:PAS domain S-box-containing protein
MSETLDNESMQTARVEHHVRVLQEDRAARKQVDEALQRYELLSAYSRDIMLFIRRDDGRILEANKAAVDVYGYSRDELLALRIHDLRARETKGLIADQLAKADLEGILFESVHRRKDGSTFPVEVSSQAATIGGVRALVSAVRDITRRRQAEEALRKANAELEQRVRERTCQLEDSIKALENEIAGRTKIEARISQLSRVFMDAADPIIIEDLSGDIIEMNREAERVYGWNRDELIGKSIKILFLPERYERAMSLRERCRHGEELRNLEGIRRDKHGRTLHLLFTAFPLSNESGRIVAIATITKDITSRKQMETELKESRRRLMELSRKSIEALEADRRAVSRELHDSIGGSLAAIRYLLEETTEQIPKTSPDAITSLTKAISYLTGTIKESKRISANLRPLTLDDLGLMATIEGHFRQFCEQYRDIDIISEIEVREEDIPESLKIVIYRILQEALTNVARHSRAEKVHVRLKKNIGRLALEIEDNGCGFKIEGSSPKDPFSGFGLKSMQERAEICSGSFSIRSRPGHGTCVQMILPLTGSHPE